MDHNFGWELLLRWVHLGTQADAERLVDLSVLGLFVLFGCAPLVGLKRPEAWLGVLLLFAVAWPPLATRLLIGRPLLVSSAVLLMLLYLGYRRELAPPRWPLIAVLSGLIAVAVFVHGVWYLWVRSDAFGCRPPRSEPPSASLASQRCPRGILHHRGTKITEGSGHGTARLGPRLRGGLRVPGRGGDRGWVETTEWTLGSNHAVEPNRRAAGPLEASPQSGGSMCGRALSRAAVASRHCSA